MKRLTVLICLMIWASVCAYSQILNVPADHSTIQAAIEAASDGDTVLVTEGTYFENINFLGKPITVASEFIVDGDTSHISKTIIDGSQPTDPDSASVVTFCSGEDTTSIIQGFTITGGVGNSNSSLSDYPAICGGGVFVDSSGAKILHNIISNNHLNQTEEDVGVWGCGIFARPYNSYSVVIRGNDISNNSGYGNGANGGGIRFRGDEIYIEGNTILGNVLKGPACLGGAISGQNWDADGAKQVMIGNNLILENKVEATGYGRGGAMWLIHINKGEAYDLDRVHIYNNVVALNSVNGEVGGIGILSGSCGLLYNNTIFGNTATEKTSNLSIWESSFVLFNNIIWTEQAASMNMFQGSSPIFVKKNNSVNVPDYTWNIDSEPEFVEGSFRLVENNGCIGRGVDSLEAEGEWYYAPKIDMLGNPRKAHERIDLGAIESDFAHFDNLLITDTIINRADAGKCNGIATIYFEGGTPPFSFLIDEEENGTKSFSGLCAGTYELSVVDGDEKKASVTVTIEDITPGKEEVFSNQFADIKIYPNPASQMTTIRFGLEQQFPICLSILNILGQENMVLIREERNPGQHEVQFDASQLKSGIYFVRLVSDKISTCKLIVQ